MREEEKTMADTENTAAPKKEGRPVISRRALCVGLGGTAALLRTSAARFAALFAHALPVDVYDKQQHRKNNDKHQNKF